MKPQGPTFRAARRPAYLASITRAGSETTCASEQQQQQQQRQQQHSNLHLSSFLRPRSSCFSRGALLPPLLPGPRARSFLRARAARSCPASVAAPRAESSALRMRCGEKSNQSAITRARAIRGWRNARMRREHGRVPTSRLHSQVFAHEGWVAFVN